MPPGHGATVVFLLRNPKVFEDDATIKPHLDSGKAIPVKGDALNADDVANAWKKAAEVTGRVDFVIFSVGL
jgi:NAD(P)-dependent dehydrogenase (short-subunit alcohol dehydrogenase family)